MQFDISLAVGKERQNLKAIKTKAKIDDLQKQTLRVRTSFCLVYGAAE